MAKETTTTVKETPDPPEKVLPPPVDPDVQIAKLRSRGPGYEPQIWQSRLHGPDYKAHKAQYRLQDPDDNVK